MGARWQPSERRGSESPFARARAATSGPGGVLCRVARSRGLGCRRCDRHGVRRARVVTSPQRSQLEPDREHASESRSWLRSAWRCNGVGTGAAELRASERIGRSRPHRQATSLAQGHRSRDVHAMHSAGNRSPCGKSHRTERSARPGVLGSVDWEGQDCGKGRGGVGSFEAAQWRDAAKGPLVARPSAS